MWPCAAPGPPPAPNAPLWWPEWPVGVCLWSGAKYSSLKEEEEQKKRERGGEGEKINREKREGGGGKSTSAANYWKNIKVFSVCVKRKKRKEGRGGRRRDGRLMAGLCVSWRIVARRGRSWPAGGDYRWREVFVWLLRLVFSFFFGVFSFFPVCPFFIFFFISLPLLSLSLSDSVFLLLLPSLSLSFFPLPPCAVKPLHKDE